MPFIDLHVHLRGTIGRDAAQRMAELNGVSVPSGYFDSDGYTWTDFTQFLNIYDQVGRVVRSAEDMHDIAMDYLAAVAAEGAIYVEFMVSPTHSEENGIPFRRQLDALNSAFAQARTTYGIEGGLIVTCVRHRGPDEAIELAEIVVADPSQSIIGFGLTGNENIYDAADFSGAFQIAGEAGLGLTAHTGEWRDAASVLHTVKSLNVTRVGHGIRAAESSAILNELVERDIGFEICLSSNLALGAGNREHHPLRKMVDAGCRISLATDDPAFFRTSPAREYQIARDVFGLSDAELAKITIDSIDMAFCGEETKARLRAKTLNN